MTQVSQAGISQRAHSAGVGPGEALASKPVQAPASGGRSQ